MMQTTVQTHYIMTNNTFLIVGHLHRGQQHVTIYDVNGVQTLPVSSSRIIRASARHYGHSLKSLTTISKQFFGSNMQKLPLCLTTTYNGPCVFFPMWAPRTTANIWANVNAIINICPHEDGVQLTLKYGQEVVIPVQYLAFCSLYSRATLFSNYIFTNRLV